MQPETIAASRRAAAPAVPSPRLPPAEPDHRVPFADLAATTREVRAEVDAAVRQVFDSGRFVGGPAVERFEQEWAEYCGAAHSVGVANGTDALHLALRALGIGPGDEVVVPTNSFVATAEAVVLAGATPRFADVSPDTLLLTPATVQAALTSRTRAVIVVHLYGQVPDMDAIGAVAAAAGLAVVEDAAQAHGASWGGRRAGALGHIGCFSFYPGKNLGAFGDAGAIVTDDADLASAIRCMRDHGRCAGSHYDHELLGTNSRLDAVQAVVLSAKLRRLDAWTADRRAAAGQYRSRLGGGPVRLVDVVDPAAHVYHLMVARVPSRQRIRRSLAEVGIETGLHYPTPCHLLAPYRQFAVEALPVAERAAGEIVSLPMFPHLTSDQVARVCDEVQELADAEERPDVA